ncbi:hypothetical protein CIC12_12975 [Burkholderia sp. SG-MS1]|nr:hypothetical protein [Paraburkholderia sp. SG-MS1]
MFDYILSAFDVNATFIKRVEKKNCRRAIVNATFQRTAKRRLQRCRMGMTSQVQELYLTGVRCLKLRFKQTKFERLS